MNLWGFIFTNPEFAYVSARVAAPTKQEAAVLVNESMPFPETRHPVLVSHIGVMPVEHPGIVHVVIRRKELVQ